MQTTVATCCYRNHEFLLQSLSLWRIQPSSTFSDAVVENRSNRITMPISKAPRSVAKSTETCEGSPSAHQTRTVFKQTVCVLSKRSVETEMILNRKEKLDNLAQQLLLQMPRRGRVQLSSVFGSRAPVGLIAVQGATEVDYRCKSSLHPLMRSARTI